MLETSRKCFTKCRDIPANRFYCCVAMVEINTIASGFGWLGPSSRMVQRCTNYDFCFSVFFFPTDVNTLINIINHLSRVLFQDNPSQSIVVLPFQGSSSLMIGAVRLRLLLTKLHSLWLLHIFVLFLQTITLGLLRSDYFNTDRNKILQVEFNTIASSFAGISSQFRHFHR